MKLSGWISTTSDVCCLFSQQLSKLYPDIRAFHSGDLVNRLTGDVSVITDAVTTIPANVTSVAGRLICAFSVLVFMQWQFAVVFAIGGLMIFGITRLLREKIKTFHKQMQSADGRVRSFWQEITENLLVVKSFSCEENSLQKSDKLLCEHYDVRMKKALEVLKENKTADILFDTIKKNWKQSLGLTKKCLTLPLLRRAKHI